MKKKIFYVYRTARKQNLDNIIKKSEPDHILYGLNHLQKLGYDVQFSDIAYSKFNLLFWFFLPLQKLFIKLTSVGFRIDQSLLLLPFFYRSDVIITTTDSAGLPILILKKIKLINKPVVFISIGFVNELVNKSKLIKRVVNSILNEADAIIVHSHIEKELYLRFSEKFKNKLHFVPFGIDNKFFNKPSKKGEYIFSVGRDKSRDYSLLSKVASRLNTETFIVVTSKSNVRGINFPQNVKVFYDLPYKEVRNLFMKTKLVFLPLKEINRASGQIAFLESLSSNNKVVISNIRGIKEVYKKLLNIKNTVVYKPDNVESAVEALVKALKIKEYKFELPSDFTSLGYAERVHSIIKRI